MSLLWLSGENRTTLCSLWCARFGHYRQWHRKNRRRNCRQFPKAKVGRLDLDSVRGKHAHEHIISSFENHEIDILVGTQMVSKGLDFDDVGLVGVIQADMLLNYPGFRSHEKAFQLLTQVSGRAGRKNKRGKVIIQTNSPDNYVLHAVVAHDFNAVKAMEMQNRQQFHYPPFCRMIQLRVQEKM